MHPPPTHRPNLYYIQQYSSAAVRTAVHLVRGEQLVGWFLRTLYETGSKRGEFHFLTMFGHLGKRASHPPPTHHPPPTIHPRTYPVLQYSNAAVRRAIYLTGEQQPIRWLQCSRAGRDLQLFTIPRHVGGQASRPREGDFHAPPSPRWGTDARSFAVTSYCCCADGTWRHREAAGGRVKLGNRSFWGGLL